MSIIYYIKVPTDPTSAKKKTYLRSKEKDMDVSRFVVYSKCYRKSRSDKKCRSWNILFLNFFFCLEIAISYRDIQKFYST